MRLSGVLWLALFSISLMAKDIYSVDDLITKALILSPDINVSKLDYKASKKRYDQAFSGYLPKVDLRADGTYMDAKTSPLFHNRLSDTAITGVVSVDQLLYDFGKTSGSTKSAKNLVQSFHETLKEQIIRKKRDVKLAYYNVLKNKALIEVNKESIKLNQAQLYRSKRYYEAGIRTKIDISDAQVRVVKAEIALQNSQYDLQSAYAVLDKVVGFTHPQHNYDVYNVAVDLSLDIYNSLPQYDLTLYEAVEYAYKNRPELIKYIYQIASNKQLQTVTQAKYYPTLGVRGDYTRTNADKYNLLLDKEQMNASVYLNWNLYSGGGDYAKVQEQKILTQKSVATFSKMKLQIKEEVTKAYIALNKTKESVKLSQNLLRLSKEKFDQVSKQYEHGLSDYIELQEARQGYIDAKSTLVISYYNYFGAMAALDATIGR
jgi:outer membrane protein